MNYSQVTEVFLVGHEVLIQNLDIFKGMCEILIIFNKCLNVGSLELSENKLCRVIIVLDLISIASIFQ
jgi:hypothetical protein